MYVSKERFQSGFQLVACLIFLLGASSGVAAQKDPAAPLSALHSTQADEPASVCVCGGVRMNEAELAKQRGLSAEILQLLRKHLGMTYDEICSIPNARLARAVEKAKEPKPDHPEEAMLLRRLQLQDEKGSIPPDGLNNATVHVALMKSMQPVSPAHPDNPPQAAGISSGAWTWLGPGNIGGRIRSILI